MSEAPPPEATSVPTSAPPFDWKNPDYTALILERGRRLAKLRSDPKLLRAAKLYYARHPADFIADWMWTYDPRRLAVGLPPSIPFVPFPRQVDFLDWLSGLLATRKSGLVEKSREVGASYLAIAFALTHWLFSKGFKAGFGSRVRDKVDHLGDPDSIFEKGRLILRDLPREFLPRGYNETTDATLLRLINRENGATIVGECGDQIGRGGRNLIYFVDESAFLEHPKMVDASLSLNTDVRIDMSSVNGPNHFYEKRTSGRVDVFVFDWREDPRKDEAWYAEKKRTLDAVVVASEIDRDYQASVEGVCVPGAWLQAAVNFEWIEDGRDVLADGLLRAGFDPADEPTGDPNGFATVKGVKVLKEINNLPGILDWRGASVIQNSRKAVELCRERGIGVLRYDKIGVGAGPRGVFLEMKTRAAAEGKALDIAFEGINVGTRGKDLPGRFEDTGRLCRDMFGNLKAQEWWRMRQRFRRTYEHREGIQTYEPHQLISIPNHAGLIADLGKPQVIFADDGKILIESKATTGTTTYADAVILAFVQRPKANPLGGIGVL